MTYRHVQHAHYLFIGAEVRDHQESSGVWPSAQKISAVPEIDTFGDRVVCARSEEVEDGKS